MHAPSLTGAGEDALRRITTAPGVRKVRLSERTDNLLIEFDQAFIDEARLLALITGPPASAQAGGAQLTRAADETLRESGWLRAKRSETIVARPAQCVAAILGFERYPEWQTHITSVTVIERDRRGRGVRVETCAKVGERELHFTTGYRFPSPNRVLFEQLDGDLDAVRGGWMFHSAGADSTRATYTLEVSPGWPRSLMLRGPMCEQLRDAVLDHFMGELRRRVERDEGDEVRRATRFSSPRGGVTDATLGSPRLA